MDIQVRIRETTMQQESYMIRMRRYFHENPELGMKERNTFMTITKELDALGIPYTKAGEYGIIARLDSQRPGKTLLIRSDMDALPIQESPDNLNGSRTCLSKTDGISHLCGHDGHLAIALGTIRILHELKDEWNGTVLFCFEQAEEHGGGIDTMLECLQAYKIDYSYATHLYAALDSNTVSVQEGPRMASVAGYTIRVTGKGGHGSRPDLCRNPAGCIVDILSLIPGMMKARLNPAYPVVFSVGEIKVGTKGNIIATDGYFSGTLRYFNYEAGVKAMDLITDVAQKTAAIHGCSISFDRKIVTDSAVINDPELSATAKKAVEAVDGLTAVTCDPWYATESFGRYQQRYPGVLALVGIKNSNAGSGAEHHNPYFDIDESTLRLAAEATVRFAYNLLH